VKAAAKPRYCMCATPPNRGQPQPPRKTRGASCFWRLGAREGFKVYGLGFRVKERAPRRLGYIRAPSASDCEAPRGLRRLVSRGSSGHEASCPEGLGVRLEWRANGRRDMVSNHTRLRTLASERRGRECHRENSLAYRQTRLLLYCL
jgi:hypothetical protein